MAKNYVRENIPLSRFGVLVAQLESIVASATQQPPDAILCFDLLSDLLSAIDEEPKDSILLWQRKCEDALYSLLIFGARRPVRHLASMSMAKIIFKGDSISIYSRASSFQGFLADGKRSEPQRLAGAAQCLGELYRLFGRKITSGLLETTIIAAKLMKFHEDFVRQEAFRMLENALEGSGGGAAFAAYNEAFRLIMRFSVGDKSFLVRISAARCLKAFSSIGGPGLGVAELDNAASCCVKGLEDPISSVRDSFAEALGALLALGMNPDAQVQPKGKNHSAPAKKFDGGLQRHLALPFMKATGPRLKDVRIGITLSWVFFLQAMRVKYLCPDGELQNFALQVMEMLHSDASGDAHALACILYILRVGVTDQMLEPTQRTFLVFLGEQLQSSDASPSMKVAALRTLAYTLKILGEVPLEFREVLDNTIVASLSDSSQLVRIEAALTLRALAEVDPTCVGGLVSYGVTTLIALRDNVSFEKGNNLRVVLDSLHSQATVLAALVTISPKLPLGYPARLPRSVFEVSKKMLTECSRNLVAATVEKEAGWLLLASLLASMPKEELEDQVFDILSLWASVFSGNPENELSETSNIISRTSVWAAAIDALIAFTRCFDSPSSLNNGILLQPVVVYLSRALSYISFLSAKGLPSVKPSLDIFIIKTLMAYQSLSDPRTYKTDHPQIIQLCTTPFRDAPGCEESSCLRLLLDKRDAWLGPWTPGRDWFEDELRAFEGGKDGLMPCVWDSETATFPQPETISKAVVNQMLLCFGTMFASQDSGGMASLLGMMEQCLKSGKRQPWFSACVTNVSVGLLAGLKALLALRSQPLGLDILNSAQSIFLGILAEGDMCASQRRASAEALGLLARLGNDIFTARMTRLLLGDLNGTTDSAYSGSIAFALGCIHRSAGGMALSSLVPSTVSSISSLAKSSVASLQIWSLHGLLLTIEAAGLSYVSHVQATLGLAMDILQSEENGWLYLQQGVGRLVNACVAVLGPELAPGSIFFSRCKSVVAEISSRQETATLLESVRFTQQLVLFAPQAVSLHTHVCTLIPTLYSRQPTLRHLAISTLRHLIEKDAVAIIQEEVENHLFHMLDEETDSEIGDLVRRAIIRLLYVSCPLCPSRWISTCRNMILATPARRHNETKNNADYALNSVDGNKTLDYDEDDEDMVSGSKDIPSVLGQNHDAFSVNCNTDKHLRFRTRIFAAECLSHIPAAVGQNPAHFDLILARKQRASCQMQGDLLVFQVQELISLAYQISTMQFENIQSIGVGLLSTIVDKFEVIPDPELPGHLLLEQYQAQLVSAVRTALDPSSGPVLLEAGMQLATKILTSGIINGDQVAIRRIYSLISRPLNEFKDLYYPSFAEWVSCKIKVRLLAAHASLKAYIFTFFRRHVNVVPDEFVALAPQFSKSSSILGKYWISILKDYVYICFRLNLKRDWKSFLDEIQSPLVSSKLQPCLKEAWPVILQALALDAVPARVDAEEASNFTVNISVSPLISGHSMVELDNEEFRFLWGFSLLVLFEGRNPMLRNPVIPQASTKPKFGGESPVEETNSCSLKLYEIVLPVFQFLASERFFNAGFLTLDICKDLLQVFSYSSCMEDAWNSLALSVLIEIVQNCPGDFLEDEDFAYLAIEQCLTCLLFQSTNPILPGMRIGEESVALLFKIAKTLLIRLEAKKQVKLVLPLLLVGYNSMKGSLTESYIARVNDLIQSIPSILKAQCHGQSELDDSLVSYLGTIAGACLSLAVDVTKDCIEGIHLLENKKSGRCKFLQMKIAFSLEQMFLFAKFSHEFRHVAVYKEYILFSVCIACTKCFRDVLYDSDTQVLAVGLQVIRSMLQRGTSTGGNSFLLFFSGELLKDIFSVIFKLLKKPFNRESGALTGESLRVLVLLQTLLRDTDGHKRIMKLLLEAILMVFSSSDDDSSQDVNDIKSTVVKLVSQLAQIPSTAVVLKEVLLEMPVTLRQQLQGLILSSVTKDSSTTAPSKSTIPTLTIKVPAQSEERRETISSPSTASGHSDKNGTEEEDDWDSFQSFSGSTGPATTSSTLGSGPQLVENSRTPDLSVEYDASGHHSSSPSRNNVKEIIEAEHLDAGVEENKLGKVVDGDESKDLHDIQVNIQKSESCYSHSDAEVKVDHNSPEDAKATISESKSPIENEESEKKLDDVIQSESLNEEQSDFVDVGESVPGTPHGEYDEAHNLVDDVTRSESLLEELSDFVRVGESDSGTRLRENNEAHNLEQTAELGGRKEPQEVIDHFQSGNETNEHDSNDIDRT